MDTLQAILVAIALLIGGVIGAVVGVDMAQHLAMVWQVLSGVGGFVVGVLAMGVTLLTGCVCFAGCWE